MTDKLTIREGSYYRTRDGQKVGPMGRGEARSSFWTGVLGATERKCGWFADGSYWPKDHIFYNECDKWLDLIAEWKDEEMDDIEWGPWTDNGPINTVAYQYQCIGGKRQWRVPVKRERKMKTLTLYSPDGGVWGPERLGTDAYRVTLTIIDDVPTKFSDLEPL